MKVRVGPLELPAVGALPAEMVERKGVGHPDTLCDELVEHLSRTLCRVYLERFGTILHHNLDKALLVGGAARPAFGGGEVVAPIELYLAGRATSSVRGVAIPVAEIAVETSRAWLAARCRHLDVARDVLIVPRIRPVSSDLAALFLRPHASGAPLANDTSFGVGYAPFDVLERAVLAATDALEGAMNDVTPWVGEDVKVMGVRDGSAVHLTVACALVGRHVRDLGDYVAKKAGLAALVRDAVARRCTIDADVIVNAADGDDADSIYLTVTGLSAEGGDDGQVGRGNRVNGLITPYRPMSLEAAAGKNPVSHVGKLYNVAAQRIAADTVASVAGVSEAYCWLVSRIGHAITEPQLCEIRLRLAPGVELEEVRAHASAVVERHLASIATLWRELL